MTSMKSVLLFQIILLAWIFDEMHGRGNRCISQRILIWVCLLPVPFLSNSMRRRRDEQAKEETNKKASREAKEATSEEAV